MILEIVRFDRPEGFSDADLLADAQSTVAHWQANQDLIRKHFVTNGDEVMGVYIWPNRAASEAAHDAAWQEMFKARTGVTPNIERYDMFMEIDNVLGEVREFAVQECVPES
ncbi:MAG: hypothetical protein AB3N11_13375 [Arenibacterium sp.]